MREGKYERELSALENEPGLIKRRLAEIKRRGRKICSCDKVLRKAKARFEIARRTCLSLPKSWRDYSSHGKNRDRYARPEVQRINDANKKLSWKYDDLKRAIESYNNRYADRKELRSRLKVLPDLIESAKQLAEIEAKKKAARLAKAKPEKDWKSKWQEVAPGLVIPSNTLRAYIKTFPYPVQLDEDTVQVFNNVFTLRPLYYNQRVYLKMPCHTWEQAERMRA